jgi:hypothetical protein
MPLGSYQLPVTLILEGTYRFALVELLRMSHCAANGTTCETNENCSDNRARQQHRGDVATPD